MAAFYGSIGSHRGRGRCGAGRARGSGRSPTCSACSGSRSCPVFLVFIVLGDYIVGPRRARRREPHRPARRLPRPPARPDHPPRSAARPRRRPPLHLRRARRTRRKRARALVDRRRHRGPRRVPPRARRRARQPRLRPAAGAPARQGRDVRPLLRPARHHARARVPRDRTGERADRLGHHAVGCVPLLVGRHHLRDRDGTRHPHSAGGGRRPDPIRWNKEVSRGGFRHDQADVRAGTGRRAVYAYAVRTTPSATAPPTRRSGSAARRPRSSSALDADITAEEQEAIAALPSGSALLVVRRGPNSGARFLLDTDVTTSAVIPTPTSSSTTSPSRGGTPSSSATARRSR